MRAPLISTLGAMAPNASNTMLVTGEVDAHCAQPLQLSGRRFDSKLDASKTPIGNSVSNVEKSSPLSTTPSQVSSLCSISSQHQQPQSKPPKTIIRVRSDGVLRKCLPASAHGPEVSKMSRRVSMTRPDSTTSLSSASSSSDLCIMTATPTSSNVSVSEVYLDADDRYRALAESVRRYTERELYEFWP